MGAFSNKMTATARKLLNKYGQVITGIRNNISDLDPIIGTVQNLSNVSYSGYGYPGQFKDDQIDGELIRRSDTRLILSSANAPELNDILTISGLDHTVINIQKITAQGNDVIYILQCRVM